MPDGPAGKAKLIDFIVKLIEAAGWSVELFSANGAHPMRLAMEQPGARSRRMSAARPK